MTAPATAPVKALQTAPAPVDQALYTNTTKPFDVVARPLHRVKSPTYDTTVDKVAGVQAKVPPDGRAVDSGARNPAMFANSKFFEGVLRTIEKGILTVIGVKPFLDAIDAIVDKIAKRKPFAELVDAIAKAIAKSIEGALFDRYMRALPAWVPVGRQQYGPDFVYDEQPATPRKTQIEEEREVEGLVTASYQLCNSLPNTQWSHYWHWAFHVRPLPGYRHLIGTGNLRHPTELNEIGTDQSKRALREVLQIYKQVDQNVDNGTDVGALECLWDVGGMSQPRGDGGSDGVMFHGNFPFWPQTGDHIWAAGRFVYDCARAIPDQGRRRVGDPGEISPTMINPCKAVAVARFEGVKFPENAGSVPAVRLFFLATSEGGYFNFAPVTDRLGKQHHEAVTGAKDGERKFKGINLRDRDYEFIVDLPPTDEKRGVYPIGRTTAVMQNTLVLRPRLLAQFRFAPFDTKNPTQDAPADRPPWGTDVFFHKLDIDEAIRPRFELILPDDPFEPPRQVRVTVPLSKLPLPDGGKPEVYGVELALGWYDPDGREAAKLTRVVVDLKHLRFHGRHSTNTVHFKACVNGQWRATQTVARPSDVPRDPSLPPDQPDGSNTDKTIHGLPVEFRKIPLFLPAGARIAVTCHGSWVHGYGEFVERKTKKDRELKFGGLVELPTALDDELQALRKLAKDNKGQLPASAQTRLDELEEILKVLDNFIGKRETADWLVDIDADRTNEQKPTDGPTLTDEQKKTIEQERVSALARALFVDPIAAFNQVDEPLGWTTFVDPTNSRLTTEAAMTPRPDDVGTVDKLLAFQAKTGQPVTHVNVIANRFWQVGSGNNLGMQVAEFRGEKQIVDYSLEIEFEATAGQRPRPVPPPPVPPSDGDPSIVPRSVSVRKIPGPAIVPASVSVLKLPGPSINPASVTVRPVSGPSINPGSVTVRPVPGPTIQPNSVTVTRR